MQNDNVKFKIGRFVIIGVIAVIMAVGGIYAWRIGVFEPKPARLVVLNAEYNFGKIKQSGGVVSSTFAVRNDGGRDAQVSEVLTSCSCTTAEIGKKIIKPGETAEVEAVFDPAAHGPAGVGKVRRVVYVETDSSEAPEIQLSFEANVTP